MPGCYDLNLRYASGNDNGGGPFYFEVDGQQVSSGIAVAPTGDWGNWNSKASNIDLTEGIHVLRLVVTNGEFNLGSMTFSYNALECADPGENTGLPFDFETTPITADFNNFDGGTGTVEPATSPQSTGNSSINLAKIVRNGGQPWAGAKIVLDTPVDFSTDSNIEARIYTIAPVGTKIEFKVEGPGGANSGPKLAYTTKTGEWETLTFDFSGVTATNLTDLVIIPYMPGNAQGDGSEAATFYFDDIIQIAPPAATCDDGIQNGDETGIDCGGPACDACPEVKLPLDFSDASQLFTHVGAGNGGSVVLQNGKLRFNGNGQAYDQAYLDLTTPFNLIEQNNNTFTVTMEPLGVADGEERTHLIRASFAGGSAAGIQIEGKSIGSAEQDVTFNFGVAGAEPWDRIIIFMDFGPEYNLSLSLSLSIYIYIYVCENSTYMSI